MITVAPDTALLFASRTVMVIVETSIPSATTLAGNASTVDIDALGAPAVNVTTAVSTTFTLPFTTALIVALPVVNDFTVPVIWPFASVVPTGLVIVSVAPLPEDNATLAPWTRLLFESRTVTVIVDVTAPSATTLAGDASTVDVAALGAPAVNVTTAVSTTFTLPFTTALIVALPDVMDFTVPVI